jgi:hypothetical protein
VDLPGETALEVMVTGVQYPMEPSAQEYRGPDRIEPLHGADAGGSVGMVPDAR